MYSAYKKESKEEIKIDSMETVKKTNIDSFAINPSLGFHGINRRYRMEFGIILSCGTFLKKRYDYSFNRSDLKNGDESYSSQFEMAKSPSITFGVLKRYKKSSFLAESIFNIPSKYDDRDFSVDDTAGIIVVRDSKRSNSFGFEQKLGYEYSLSSSTAFSCGIGYWQIRQNDDLSTSSESRKNSTNVRILFSSFGFDKKISENTKILFASSCYIMFSKLELKSGAFSIKINSHEFFPNIMFALVQKF